MPQLARALRYRMVRLVRHASCSAQDYRAAGTTHRGRPGEASRTLTRGGEHVSLRAVLPVLVLPVSHLRLLAGAGVLPALVRPGGVLPISGSPAAPDSRTPLAPRRQGRLLLAGPPRQHRAQT